MNSFLLLEFAFLLSILFCPYFLALSSSTPLFPSSCCVSCKKVYSWILCFKLNLKFYLFWIVSLIHSHYCKLMLYEELCLPFYFTFFIFHPLSSFFPSHWIDSTVLCWSENSVSVSMGLARTPSSYSGQNVSVTLESPLPVTSSSGYPVRSTFRIHLCPSY